MERMRNTPNLNEHANDTPKIQPPSSRPLVVVLDAMGVIYKSGDDVGELLIPFAREKGCSLSDADITKIYTECSLGRFTSAEFWNRLGIPAHKGDLDREYLQRHSLSPGLLPFLASMQKNGVSVGCISNDISEWSLQLRRSFKLEHYFFNWTISGDVRTRKPDTGIYEHFLRSTEIPAQRCVFIDDRKKNLDAARGLSFQTLYFSTDCSETGSHDVVANFNELQRRIDALIRVPKINQ